MVHVEHQQCDTYFVYLLFRINTINIEQFLAMNFVILIPNKSLDLFE